MAKSKYYVVWEGHQPGVYSSWLECQQQTSGYKDAKYKSYESRAEADKAYRDGWKKHWGQSNGAAKTKPASTSGKAGMYGKRQAAATNISMDEIDYDSISVDVGTRGNPGPVEYKGVDTRTGQIIFSKGPIAKGTNNMGEFLAIVHALAYLHQQGSNKTVYSDSENALKWVKQKKAASTLVRDASTAEIWELVDRAEQWLRTHTYSNKLLKWETRSWGEIKADYGRK
ncbi:ribonuclease H [Paenibacillus campi]|uniref:ribonuclease H n=1 Tax=Paenibacillus campi TaxID=3106031 RepID=UPI002B000AA3|nr:MULTISPECIES: ribonuclease H family protein [unclassified Paenibacillus]